MKSHSQKILMMGALLFAATGLRAGAIVSLSSVASSGVDYTWTYNATFTNGLHPGDEIVIYDFNNYYAGSLSVAANFSGSALLTGPVPSLISVQDSSGVWNLALVYNGPAVSSPTTVSFSAGSTLNTETTGGSAYQDSVSQGFGTVTIPGASGPATNGPFGAFSGAVLGSPAAEGSGQYLVTFQIDNPSGGGFGTGSFLTVLDIPGYVTGSIAAPPNWNCSALLTGGVPGDWGS